MIAARNKADGVANLLVEAKADLNATNKVRLVGLNIYVLGSWLVVGPAGRGRLHHRRMHACMRACVHVQRCRSRSLPWHPDLTRHLHHHRDCRRDGVRRMDGRR